MKNNDCIVKKKTKQRKQKTDILGKNVHCQSDRTKKFQRDLSHVWLWYSISIRTHYWKIAMIAKKYALGPMLFSLLTLKVRFCRKKNIKLDCQFPPILLKAPL